MFSFFDCVWVGVGECDLFCAGCVGECDLSSAGCG